VLKHVFIAGIRFYQRFLSPLKPAPTCRFVPTCSSYALQAIRQRGVLMGTLLATWRILRCNPFVPGGYDPVPRAALPASRHAPGCHEGCLEAASAEAENPVRV